jgi:hypothetical protein
MGFALRPTCPQTSRPLLSPIGSYDLRLLLRKAEIPDSPCHDTRPPALSPLVLAGVDLYTIREILGHKTLAMRTRALNLSPGHHRQALEPPTDRQTPNRPQIQLSTRHFQWHRHNRP